MAKILTETLKTIENYKITNPHYNELFDILSDILILREEYRQKMDGVTFPLDERLIAKKLAGGLPLLDFSTGDFDFTVAKDYFLRLLQIAEKRLPGETTEFTRQIREGKIDFETMIRNSFNARSNEEFAFDIDEDAFDLIDLFLEESLRPALESFAEKYGGIIRSSGWNEGYCPICGKEPKIGEIKGDKGRRFLFCNQCGFEWKYSRIKCPFCGNEEQQTLAYFTVEEEERYRVDVCNVCKRYVKMVDFRDSGGKANLDVEDIATLHLDMLAAEEGYE
ncbi:MAG: formate dehydrogenase accessory protein FdhE [Syntrophobacteraceae bacterium CG23_combo_of_CG06-09_8_20_14_all_50_8]|nr:MAG: formate dehydrogenase accessory protein FdhE [Syntrophobacteraceae bacterium CG23_combo_of_CG06-09_8_20_14_all_50_8]